MINPDKLIVCFYHNEDLDGYASAAIVYDYYSKQPDYITVMMGVDYGVKDDLSCVTQYIDKVRQYHTLGTPAGIKTVEVVIVDYSFSPRVMKHLASNYKVTWLDHHKSAIQDSIDNDYAFVDGVREIGIGACYITYVWFHRSHNHYDKSNSVKSIMEVPDSIVALAMWDVFDFGPFNYNYKLFTPNVITNWQYYLRYCKDMWGVDNKAISENSNDFFRNYKLIVEGNIFTDNVQDTGSLLKDAERARVVSTCVRDGRYVVLNIKGHIISHNVFVVIGHFGSSTNAFEAEGIVSVRQAKRADLIVNIIPELGSIKVRFVVPDNSDFDASLIAREFDNGGGHAKIAGAHIKDYILIGDNHLILI